MLMMNGNPIQSAIEKVGTSAFPKQSDIEFLLSLESDEDMQLLFDCACKIRGEFCGDGIIVRTIVEFSNFCRNNCLYCGLNKHNKSLVRYRLSKEELLEAVKKIDAAGIKTVVMQSGEDDELDALWLEDIIREIKKNFDMAVTLSVGERSKDEYKLWKDAGADRYLLKIETTDKALYQSLHPGMSFENRINCSMNLKNLGYQNGSGCIVGLKGQTIPMLAQDLLFFKKEDFDMIGIGLFIPHENTPLGNEPSGNLKLTLKTLALTRILTKNAHLPATTAIGSMGGTILALRAGANVIMLNFTPEPYREFYDIYPDKTRIRQHSSESLDGLEIIARQTNNWIDYSTGDSLKYQRKVYVSEI